MIEIDLKDASPQSVVQEEAGNTMDTIKQESVSPLYKLNLDDKIENSEVYPISVMKCENVEIANDSEEEDYSSTGHVKIEQDIIPSFCNGVGHESENISLPTKYEHGAVKRENSSPISGSSVTIENQNTFVATVVVKEEPGVGCSSEGEYVDDNYAGNYQPLLASVDGGFLKVEICSADDKSLGNGELFPSDGTQRDTKESQNKNNSLKCSQCERVFYNLSKGFMTYYTRDEPLICHLCQKPEYECDFCNYRFAIKIDLSRHILTHIKKMRCKVCRQFIIGKSNLAQHILGHTMAGERVRPISRKRGRPISSERDRPISRKRGRPISRKRGRPISSERVRPISSERGRPISSERVRPISSERVRPILRERIRRFSCPICGLVFHSEESLSDHRREFANAKFFHCELCPFTAVALGHLKTHFHTHLNHKTFKCHFCKRFCYSIEALNQHVKIHTDVRSFSCRQCKVTFHSKYGLNSHLFTHNEQKCNLCETAFRSKVSKLNKHLKQKGTPS